MLSMIVCLGSAAPAFAQLPPNMRSYYVALMKKGPAWTAEPSPETNAVQQAQMAYLERLETEKKLIGAGPISDSSELSGGAGSSTSRPRQTPSASWPTTRR